MRFQLKEEPKLEGTSKLIVQTENPSSWGSASALRLWYGSSECVALIDSVVSGPDLLLIDKYLLLHLNVKGDSLVEVEPIELGVATEATVLIPSEWLGTVGEKRVRENLLNKPFISNQNQKFPIRTFSGDKTVIIAKIVPHIARITEKTKMEFQSLKVTEGDEIGVTYGDIGGLGPVLKQIRELIEFPMLLPDAMSYIGIEPPKGILLSGPSGTGKTLIAKALANSVGAKIFTIQGPEIISAYYGKSEEKLRKTFEEAQAKAPSIILIDEIDSIAPKRDVVKGELEIKVVTTLLGLMDGLKKTKGIMVIGTTNRPNAIDQALRRPGRLEDEIYIGIPNMGGRKEILEIHTRAMPLAEDINRQEFLQELAEKTHGFTGADIASLCRKAGYSVFRRHFNVELIKKNEAFDLAQIEVTRQDFEEALRLVSPSALREVLVQIPKDVTWEKIGGLKEIKTIIEENIIQGIKNPQVFKEMGIPFAKGILFYGPPGTGKTLIAKALANECGANFISVKGPELRSKWFGESEEKIRFIFDTARKAAPCIIFFDEIDALAPSRGKDASGLTDSIVNQLLAETDGVQTAEGVFVVGATNRLELLDGALLRPGRFNYKIEVPLPDENGRREIFAIHLKKEVLGEDVDLDKIAEETDGFSGAEIAEAHRLSGLKALEEVGFQKPNKISMKHLTSSIEEIIVSKKKERSIKHERKWHED